jgi:hypothetical protein
MQAEGEMRFTTVPFTEEVGSELSDGALIHRNRAVREKGFRESEERCRAPEEKAGLRELASRLPK